MSQSTRNAVIWVVVAFFAANSLMGRVIDTTSWRSFAPFLPIALMTLFVLLHGPRQIGWRQVVVLFALAFVVSWSYETASIATGFPFGRYHYSDFLGPKLGTVPFLIMPAYYAVAYISWHLGLILLDRFSDRRRDALAIWILPVIASFIMVMWDMSMDPARSTRGSAWIWEQGGGYFGVPFSNFMGWLLCVWTIFQLYALYLYVFNTTAPIASNAEDCRANWYQVVGIWSGLIGEFLVYAFFPLSDHLTDPSGKVWNTVDMYESLGLVAIFSMLFVAVLASARVATTERLTK